MKKLLYILFLHIISNTNSVAQTVIKGKITDRKGESLIGASISIKGSYDGATADTLGNFSFSTRKKDSVIIVASFIGYDNFEKRILLQSVDNQLDIQLKEAFNELNAVVITAGTFEASDNKRMVMLRPMDIITTASGGADITSVMQLLPGANRVGEQEGLFVRGGSANETKTVIDGMIVQNPFFSSTPDVPQRGRFSPFMFKGTAFSTGGYSAQYGQALSSVLLLDTQDKTTDESSTNILAHLAGVGVSHTHKGWITGQIFYSNLTPFLKLVPRNIDYIKIPQGLNGSLTVNQNVSKNGVLKMYATVSNAQSALGLPSYDSLNRNYTFRLNNLNFFTNNTYKHSFKDGKWSWLNGFSYSYNTDKITIAELPSDRKDARFQLRSVLKRQFGKHQENTFLVGSEFHNIQTSSNFQPYNLALTDNYSALFAESDFYVTQKLAIRLGVRGEYSSAIDKINVAPRLSLAYKTGQYSQVSVASGQFYQTPENNYLYLNKTLNYELANHFIANFQIIKNDRTFRFETFYKDYKNLIREFQPTFNPNPYRFPTGKTDNSGDGFASGFDVFFRDKKSIKYGDFWVTYSYLNTKRLFRNYPVEAMPTFASNHNLSVVYKQFVPKLMTNFGLTYTYTSGRPYFDAASDFLNDRTKPFHHLSAAASYIRPIKGNFCVFFLTIDNVLATRNEFGFRYSADGKTRFPVIPTVYRTFFFGVSINLAKKAEIPKEGKLDI
jgi:CarboxypepD_reg-like domain/TonB-dependent Receptor Plug Domain